MKIAVHFLGNTDQEYNEQVQDARLIKPSRPKTEATYTLDPI